MLKAGPNIAPTSPLGEALRLLPGETVHTQANTGADVPKVLALKYIQTFSKYFFGTKLPWKGYILQTLHLDHIGYMQDSHVSVLLYVLGRPGSFPRWLYPC